MNIVVKGNGQIINVDVIKSKINDIIGKKKHLCGGCQALVCRADDRLASEVVKEGLRTTERYYVFKCDGYKAMDIDYFLNRSSFNESESDYIQNKYASLTYSIVHPTVRSRFR